MINIKKLPNGLTVVMEYMPYLKSASFGVWVKAGSAYEDENNNGISHIIEHMMFKGTRNRTARQIADEMARLGGNINAFTSKECTSFYATTLSEHLPMAIRILGDMLNNSLIDEKALRKEKSVILEEIDMYEDSPEDLVHDILQQKIWQGHPLGYMISGTKKIVRHVRREQILRFMDTFYTAENMVISIAGNFNEEEIFGIVEEEFGGIRSRGNGNGYDCGKPSYRKVTVRRNKDIEQLHINIAFDCISYLSEERFTLSVLNSVLGGSVNSRLFQKIREDDGLAYSIYSYGSSYKDTGLLHIYAAVNPDQKDVVIGKIFDIVGDIKAKGITEQELEMTKEQIKTELILGSEGAKNRMNHNGKSMLFRGRPVPLSELIKGIENVTMNDVSEFADRYLDISGSSLSLMGNFGRKS